MQFGFSSYTFQPYIRDGRMTLLDVIDWIGASDGTHMEIATVSLSDDITNDTSTLDADPALVAQIKQRADAAGVALSSFVVPANFVTDSVADYEADMGRVKRHIDVAAELGIRLFRHDVVRWADREEDVADFERQLPIIVEASKEIAQYGAQFGITTSIENHGLLMNASERVRRLIHLVDEPNFKTTLDIGNFLVVDEDPVVAVPLNAPLASIVHLKDFYIRRQYPGEGWLHTKGGSYLLGSIIGFGDIDMRSVIGSIVDSGFDGYVSLEFEGNEDALFGATTGLANTLRLFAEAS